MFNQNLKNMKKNFLLLVSVMFLFSMSAMAQICSPPCTPDPTCQDLLMPGEICPLVLPTAVANQYYDETVTVIPPATFEIGGNDYDIEQIRIDNVEGLPEGMTWCKSQEMFVVTDPATRYCCQLTGTPTVVGEYQLTLTITPYYNLFGFITALPQQTDDTSLVIIVIPEIDAPVAAFSANPTTAEINTDVVFTDLSTNLPTAWAWVFEGGSPATSNAQNPTVQWTTQGSYTVSLTASNAGGDNTLEISDYITITDHTGVNNPVFGDVKVYPNPASHEITVEAANMESVCIVDILGKVVYSTEVKAEKTTIDVSKFNKANYFIKVKTSEGEITKSITIK